MLTCTNCGHENPDDARFCSSCGSALTAVAAPREERKVVTVLFADLVGFTSRSERLDPEDVRATLTPYFGRLREELERRGGTVEKFIGDAVMAVFGAPTAHEDDPERAVRAAIGIRDAVAEMNEQDPDLDLHVRIGVNTGEALVSLAASAREGEGVAAGDVVNTAARLQAAASVDGILVGEATHRATDRAIAYRVVDPIDAKGKADPVAAWETVELRARFGVDVIRRTDTTLVGREQELALLRDTLDRVRHRNETQLVTLVGEPGIGKSRLVHELYAHIESFPDLITWRQGRSLPYGEGISYWALGEMVKAEAGILETDTDEEAAAAVDEMVAELIPDPDERSWVARHLRPLTGLARDGSSGETSMEDAHPAWRRFLEALGERRPTVLIFEDLHWADEGLLDFIDQMIDWTRDVPLLVLATARPELLARRPGWGGGKSNASTISLGPLSDDETARLLGGLLDRSVLPAELQTALLARAGGNPLYAEEFARMAETRSADDLAEVELPDSIQGIIAARLDALDPDDKTVLQDASVVGKTFWSGAVGTIGVREAADIERRLHELERRRFVRRARRSSVGGESEYAFLHLLVRDVAYGQIPRAARAEKHLAAAAWIESLGRDRLEDRAEPLAHHYLSALELARAAGLTTDEIERPARIALRGAGDRALGLGAYAAAERAYGVAVELWPADDPERPGLLMHYGRTLSLAHDTGEEFLEAARDGFVDAHDLGTAAEAELLIGDLAWRRGQGDEAQAHTDRALELTQGLVPTPELAAVKSHLARFYMVAGRQDDAIRVGRDALAIAHDVGREDLVAFALNSVGTARVTDGDLDGFRDIEESIEAAERAQSPWHITRNRVNLGVCLYLVGDVRRALEVHERNLEDAFRYGMEGAIIWNRAEVAFELMLTGRWDESLAILDPEIARMESAPHYLETQNRWSRARIRQGRGDVDGAFADIDRAVELGRRAKDPQALFPCLAGRARLLVLEGRADEATVEIDEILRSIGPEPVIGWSYLIVEAAMVLREVGRAEELLALGGEDVGSEWIRAARRLVADDFAGAAEIFEGVGSVADEAFARTTEAQVLIAAGRRDEAQPTLARALHLYRAMGATAFLRDAERLLAPSA